MLFHITYCSTFFFAVLAAKSDKKLKQLEDGYQSEVVFANVIKNISRVNNVLQELISNYEQLQKLYKSQENFNSHEYSNDPDNDSTFKLSKKSNVNKAIKIFDNSKTAKTKGVFLQATQMLLSSESLSDESETEPTQASTNTKPEITTKSTLKSEKTIKMKNQASKKTVLEKTTEAKRVSISSDESSYTDESNEAKTTTAAKDMFIIPPTGPGPQIVFVDTHKKIQARTEKKKPRIMPEIVLENVTKKTRYMVKEKYGSLKNYRSENPGHYSLENFNVSIPITSKQIQIDLMNHGEGLEKILTKSTILSFVTSSKSNDNKNGATMQTGITEGKINIRSGTIPNKTAEETAKANTTKKADADFSDMSVNDEALTKDMFKTSVLRQAYGDACLKLVVRKCYKACKTAIKSSCRNVKCKSDLKTYFKDKASKGCDSKFADTPHVFRKDAKKNEGHVDLLKEGYISMACQPPNVQNLPIMLRSGLQIQDPKKQSKERTKEKQLNILRAKYEKECRKTSQQKCKDACNYACTETCKKFECSKQLKKKLKKNCSTQCKIAYSSKGGHGGRGSDSSGSSGTGSSSGDSSSDSSSGS